MTKQERIKLQTELHYTNHDCGMQDGCKFCVDVFHATDKKLIELHRKYICQVCGGDNWSGQEACDNCYSMHAEENNAVIN